jgi:hypothetical protein
LADDEGRHASPIAPLEVLGIAADEVTGTAMPVIAQ